MPLAWPGAQLHARLQLIGAYQASGRKEEQDRRQVGLRDAERLAAALLVAAASSRELVEHWEMLAGLLECARRQYRHGSERAGFTADVQNVGVGELIVEILG